MLYIVWVEKNNLGIPIIDEQHRGLVATINSLYYFIQEGHGAEALRPTLTVLEQYTYIHFTTEEALMREAGYPALESHILLHKHLAEKTREISQESAFHREADTALKFLRGWWLGHLNREDRKYAPYVIKKLRNK
jgi:hemerythrin